MIDDVLLVQFVGLVLDKSHFDEQVSAYRWFDQLWDYV